MRSKEDRIRRIKRHFNQPLRVAPSLPTHFSLRYKKNRGGLTMSGRGNSGIGRRAALAVCLLGGIWAGTTHAQGAGEGVEALRAKGYSVRAITLIFSQLVAYSVPPTFVPAFRNTTNGHYTQELVPQGETVQNWTQMITVTGAQGLASAPNLTPKALAERMAAGFKDLCPASFSAARIGELKVGEHDAFGAVIGCGTTGAGSPPRSEHMLLIVIKGQADYYTIQWAERGPATQGPAVFEQAKWVDRLKRLAPINLCPIVEGEKPPFPSCANRK